jgi:hypothetical protein
MVSAVLDVVGVARWANVAFAKVPAKTVGFDWR